MSKFFVCYYRVSTDGQGLRGLGMDAQRQAVATFLAGRPPLAEFAEVESGKRRDRPELGKALALCRESGAVLLIAKLDRLARDAAFLLSLRDSGVDFLAADMPNADRFMVGIMAMVAEHERDMISQRTKDALAAAKRRGIKLGNPHPEVASVIAVLARRERAEAFRASVLPVIREIQSAHVSSLREIARCLNARGVKSSRGGKFGPQVVSELLLPPPRLD